MSFGAKDARLARRGEDLLEAIVAKSSLVLRKVGGGRAGEIAMGRFLDNDDVTAEGISQPPPNARWRPPADAPCWRSMTRAR